MKHNWTYKKLNEVCEKASSNIALNKIENNIGEYPLYGASGLVKHIDFYHKDKPYIGIIKDGAGVGRVGKYPAKSSLVGTMQYIHPNEEICHIDYLYFALQSLHLNESVTGATIPHIYFKDYGKLSIPIPSLDEQKSIVQELDGINRLIDLQEEQLREYDRLAQSLFYSTFGDPTTNPKGWEVKKLSDVVSEACKMSYGIVQPGDDIEDGVPVVRPIDFKDSEYIQRKGLKKTLPSISDSYKRTILRGDEILICVRGTTGTMGLATPELKGCNVTRGIVPLYFRNEMNKWFMYKYLKSNFAQNIIAENTYGATLKQINISALRSIPIMCPPLALQQSFAAQIEAIEQQKALIRRSLDETRTLLAARMQYYFE